jgi:azurin
MKTMTRVLFVLSAAAAAVLAAPSAMAAECAVTVESNDAMQFNLKSLEVPKSCKSYEITLKHVGKLPKTAMGHNVVISKTADMAAVAKDGIGAGVAQGYLKAEDARVLAHTALIGGGESSTVTLDVTKLAAAESYSFFCSFPGHSSIMKGSLKLGV